MPEFLGASPKGDQYTLLTGFFDTAGEDGITPGGRGQPQAVLAADSKFRSQCSRSPFSHTQCRW